MDNYRNLLQELMDAIDSGIPVDRIRNSPLAVRVDAALAQPEPEVGPTDEELALIYHDCCRGCEFMDQGGFEDAARALLARWGHQPAPPAEGEVAELVADLKRESSAYSLLNSYRRWQLRLTRAADLLEQRHPAPVPVAERPWEREGWCDEQGRCWWGRQESGDWYADWTFSTCEDTQEFCTYSPMTVCLPAHTLPLPAGEVKK